MEEISFIFILIVKRTKALFSLLIVALLTASCEEEEVRSVKDEISNISKELEINLVVNEFIVPKNAIHFNSIEEMKDWIIKIESELKEQALIDSEAFNKAIDEDENDNPAAHYGRCSSAFIGRARSQNVFLATARLRNIFTSFEYTASISNGTVRSFTGYLIGITLGVSYTHGLHVQRFSNRTDDIIVHSNGIMNYHLFVAGIGTVYRRTVEHTVVFDCEGFGGQADEGWH